MKNKRTKLNLTRLILTMALMLITLVTFAQRGGANFSGSWGINYGNSELGEAGRTLAASSIEVKQDRNSLLVQRTTPMPDGSSYNSSEKYTMDGQNNINTGMMNMQVQSTVTRAGNDRTLTIQSTMVYERDFDSIEIKTAEVWTLSADGNTLTIDSVASTTQGEWKRKFVYDKK